MTPSRGNRARVKRLHEKASYEVDARNAVLDDTFLCHIGYEVDGQPFVIPTSCWRDGDRLYWHGSSKSGMVRALSDGAREACVTVTHLDGLVLARSGFETSVSYRTAICYGKPHLVSDANEFETQLCAFMEKLAPGRWDRLRAMKDQEIKATALIAMDITDFAVKISDSEADDGDDDIAADAIWAGVIPIRTVAGEAVKNSDCGDHELDHPVMPDYFRG